ncbi:sulfotransferase [Mangrovimonas aestuarii]|uniref:sulfotransferase n=1 Tax=Mangrovimonas aestuarii TaxID=3018443 RepID=UPI002378A609|nr:sulfotransferase [Mangrovimonas aestuarii]
MNKVVILLGQRVRSGTNFVGTTIGKHPDIVTFPPDKSMGEFNLFPDRAIKESVFDKVSNYAFGINISSKDELAFFEAYGELWLKLLKEKYRVDETKTIFIKSFIVYNLDLWQKAFPNAKIAMICRDGRDNVISSVKASNDKRNWHNWSLRVKKKAFYALGLYFLGHALHWKKTARAFSKIQECAQVKKFRYEDLVDSKTGIEKLLHFYGLDTSDEIISNCINAPVVGSSFGVDSNNEAKPNWQPDYDKSKFNFIGKWSKWGPFKRALFKLLANKEMTKLGYYSNDLENDLDALETVK